MAKSCTTPQRHISAMVSIAIQYGMMYDTPQSVPKSSMGGSPGKESTPGGIVMMASLVQIWIAAATKSMERSFKAPPLMLTLFTPSRTCISREPHLAQKKECMVNPEAAVRVHLPRSPGSFGVIVNAGNIADKPKAEPDCRLHSVQ
jgi:hypothetical protein